jgi:type VI secretion system protein ImpA
MPTPELLNIEELLQPIPGEDPAGSSLAFTVREQLEDKRKELNPEDFAPDDPARPEHPKRADWSGIRSLAEQSLRESSKDLLLAARLTEALTKQHGFAGARDGFRLMRHMVADCWDRILPSIEDGDLEVRAGPFNWLDDNERGARYPFTLRNVPIVNTNSGPCAWHDWRQAMDGKGSLSKEEIDAAIAAATREHCQELADDIDGCLVEVRGVSQALDAHLGREAPGFTSVLQSLGDCRTLVQQILVKKGPAPSAATDEGEASEGEADAGAAGEAGPPGKGRATAARREVIYADLVRAADQLRQLEPHSPVPYLILKAVELGNLSFPRLMQRLIRENGVLAELNRELGIACEEPNQIE